MKRKFAKLPIALLETLSKQHPELNSFIPARRQVQKAVHLSRAQNRLLCKQLSIHGQALIRVVNNVARVSYPRFYEVKIKHVSDRKQQVPA